MVSPNALDEPAMSAPMTEQHTGVVLVNTLECGDN